ncbi:otolin-1-like [Ylistrum balloti]|uniref:otolin-1-like n=1 Tax=Ylistrum balloti TaxID=509963 RepID=UPI002905A426|nr:otolin-1-like [Ylistrum balloti]
MESLQNQIISLERMVQQISGQLTDLNLQHTQLERKHFILLDELRTLRVERCRDEYVKPRNTAESKQQKRLLTQGQKGDKGDRGERGPKGNPGTSGFNGDDGFNGDKGMKGDKGSIGAKGAPGPKGTKEAFSYKNIDSITLDRSPTILTFNRTDLSSTEGYDPSTGIFQCTVTGTYVVTWSIEVEQNSAVRSYLYRNGKTMSFLSVTSPLLSSSSGSQFILLHLDENDRLNIEAQSILRDQGIITHSTFAAFLL